MSPESLLQDFGYLAVFVGTFLEGEAILITAGFFASRGYLDPMIVCVVAFAGFLPLRLARLAAATIGESSPAAAMPRLRARRIVSARFMKRVM